MSDVSFLKVNIIGCVAGPNNGEQTAILTTREFDDSFRHSDAISGSVERIILPAECPLPEAHMAHDGTEPSDGAQYVNILSSKELENDVVLSSPYCGLYCALANNGLCKHYLQAQELKGRMFGEI